MFMYVCVYCTRICLCVSAGQFLLREIISTNLYYPECLLPLHLLTSVEALRFGKGHQVRLKTNASIISSIGSFSQSFVKAIYLRCQTESIFTVYAVKNIST